MPDLADVDSLREGCAGCRPYERILQFAAHGGCTDMPDLIEPNPPTASGGCSGCRPSSQLASSEGCTDMPDLAEDDLHSSLLMGVRAAGPTGVSLISRPLGVVRICLTSLRPNPVPASGGCAGCRPFSSIPQQTCP